MHLDPSSFQDLARVKSCLGDYYFRERRVGRLITILTSIDRCDNFYNLKLEPNRKA